MKIKLKSKTLPALTAGLGIITLILRLGLYLVGTDQKGLLIPGHPLSILSWVVTAAASVLIIGTVCRLDGSQRYSDNFEPSTAAAIGAFALAGGIAVSVISGWTTYLRLEQIRNLCGLLVIPALILAGLCRWQGKRPKFLLHGIVCLYLTLHTVSHYQIWCSRPQLQSYFFPMAASIGLTLFAYYQTAFDVGMGRRRMQLAAGLMAAFFCISAAAGLEDIPLYLGGAVWTLTNLCSLFPVPCCRPELPKEDHDESA